jgi:hypothetical protein
MVKAVVDLGKGDTYEIFNLSGVNYVATDSVAPLSNADPVEFFTLDAESNSTPVEAEVKEATSLQLKSFVVDLDDVVFCTNGKLYHAIVD